MPVTVIVGGQFGSEGKGKVAHFMAQHLSATAVIRIGGPNSGHTVLDSFENPIIFKHLSTAAILPKIICALPAGNYIHLPTLLQEINETGITPNRLWIDPNAVILTEIEINKEKTSKLQHIIGSTQSGLGAAVINRIKRTEKVTFAKDEKILKPFLRNVTESFRKKLDDNERILIEGTQGFGLSILHSPYYPYVTSRDTTAAGFVSEAGLSPLDVDDIVMVIRAFPIRVSGNSGPLWKECLWEEVTKNSGSKTPLLEFTSVTKKQRRVGKFDPSIVKQAIMYNKPTKIVLNHLDYIDIDCIKSGKVSKKAENFLNFVEKSIGQKIDYIGNSRVSVKLLNQ